MALGATVYNLDIDLADHNRGVFESLSLRVARHPSESEDYLWARVIAYALEYVEGIAFSPGGLSDPDQPAIAVRDLTGALEAWIEVGTPDAARLNRAAKAAGRVAVYVHREPGPFLERLAGERIHQANRIVVVSIDRALLTALGERLERRLSFSLSVSDDELFVAIGDATLTGRLKHHTIGA